MCAVRYGRTSQRSGLKQVYGCTPRTSSLQCIAERLQACYPGCPLVAAQGHSHQSFPSYIWHTVVTCVTVRYIVGWYSCSIPCVGSFPGPAQGWYLPPRHFINSDKIQRPKVPVFYERVYAMQSST